tara:strand:- start:74527 stop:75561 length:1035 start_codon:yes stop_codon:yes gene_type:complete
MKALAMIITLILTQQVLASNSCFDTQAVKDLIAASKELDECFDKDVNNCNIDKMSVEDQRELNSQRLIPHDRTKDTLMNDATGAVSANFDSSVEAASGQKISSCHIITSAHLLYKNTNVQVDNQDFPALKDSEQFDINFHSGQTCDARLFEKSVGAQVYFKMTDAGKDFVCSKQDNSGKCLERRFFGKSDLVILKLKNYNKNDKNFFKLKTTPNAISAAGDRVNCWGYPEYNNQIKLSKDMSDKMLWFQKDAKIFNGNYDRGVLTNAIAYPGMSGGGCVASAKPNELIGVFAAGNSATGHSAVEVTAKTADTKSANFLSSFQTLAERYKQATNKDIADLDKECE